MKKIKSKSGRALVGPAKRTRLAPEVRRKQILEAALVEFSALGFSATSISKIAERVGISKANVYVHFSSKDEIFETLLQSLLGKSESNWMRMQQFKDMEAFVDNLIEVTYGSLTPETLAILRLLIAEGHRIPGVLAKWNAENLRARKERQAMLDQLVASGGLKASPITENFEFAMTPLVYVAVAHMILGDSATKDIQEIKDTHRKVLHMLLKA